MKFSFVLAALAAPLLAAAVSVTPRTSVTLNPQGATLHPVNNAGVGLAERSAPETNAERLRRGLPIKAPHRRHHASPVGVARAEPSTAPPTIYSGKLQARKTDGTPLGYIAKNLNVFGEYGLSSDASNAQVFSFTTSGDKMNVVAVGGGQVSSLPSLGAAIGFSNSDANFSPGSYNYAYLVGSSQTSPGSTPTPVQNTNAVALGNANSLGQSAIWKYDAAAHTLKAQWINTDGSSPATYLVYTVGDNVLSITGDQSKFSSTFGSSPEVTLFLV